ncbi:MAG: hypothetical protein Q7U98_11580 [Methylicorpusculum sp.]|uniref:hypothetical protein n=1 Tax=Methylicorpusculum sp. TaxID=2713644 RepID=UPI00271F3A6C|nr:hypothetical protein [Methylicorpusculum sp.]MDO8843102.1 hypothetical protein [Methylicorpusculum sp.]MDO8939788.1 hypothetical protein [Methylicorpusculum sp.]MDO9242127.1 hypothetical protein [Methylicorpusculum sp.]MDP2180774.1 hypothetical protein [Methylicorpusculum sp.]MDP2201409.1 hypothetical protein [Methylicorpusculum sp.]
MNSSVDLGVISVLLERFEKQRLPRALSIKEKVDNGECLEDYDIEFLKEVFADAQEIMPMGHRHPEYQELIGKITSLYHEITERGLKNQELKSGH